MRPSTPSLSEEARAYSRDEHEAHLLEQFFSWPPPPPRAADLTFEPFERQPMDRGSRRAMWLSGLMLTASALLIAGYFTYQDDVVLRPAALGSWSDTDTLALPTPILAPDIVQPDLEPRRTYQASLLHAPAASEPVAPAVPNAAADGADARASAPALGSGSAETTAAAQAQGSGAQPSAVSEAERREAAARAKLPGASANAASAEGVEGAARGSEGSTEAANVASQQGLVEESVRAELAPDFDAQLAQARKLLAQGDNRAAVPVFERALSLRAHSVDALLGKAAALFALQDYEAAKSSAQQAVAIDPRSHQGFALIGESFERLGQREAAQNIYQRCIEQAVDLTQCRERLNQLSATR